MAIVGIVAEYNPFHGGHAYHIAETRRILGDCTVVCAMSGNFVQRGDCAIDHKWSRAAAAVEGGADLVLELPTVWAVSSAESFARGALSILKMAGADTLSFGSESGSTAALKELAAALDTEAYKTALRSRLDSGLPFARCRQLAAEELVGRETAALLENPNDNLGVEYLRAAAHMGWSPSVVAVRRQGAGHDGGDHPLYPSASHIRRRVLSGQEPMEDPASLTFNERAVLTRLRAMTEADFAAIPDCGEGLSNRLYTAARKALTLTELYDLAKTKRYAHARIRRAVLWAALGLTAADRPDKPPYLRVLAANGQGRGVLKDLPEEVTLITKPTHGKGIPLLELEASCTDFYAMCKKHPAPCGAEWTTSPMIK